MQFIILKWSSVLFDKFLNQIIILLLNFIKYLISLQTFIDKQQQQNNFKLKLKNLNE